KSAQSLCGMPEASGAQGLPCLPNIRTGREHFVGALRPINRDAVRQMIESPPVHVQDERRPLVPGMNTVHILWHKAYANARTDGRATTLPDLPLARDGIVANLFMSSSLFCSL